MGEQRSAHQDVLTVSQYRDTLRFIARIEDERKSLEVAFLWVTMGRLGLRVGEVVHMQPEWYKKDRFVIAIPPHEPCNCGLCSHYAKKYAERNGLDEEEVKASYWKVKDGSHRDVPVKRERDRQIIERYFDEFGYTKISYSTVLRRLKRIAEIRDDLTSDRVYPHMLRATAATHLLWSGFAPAGLDVIFGWQDEKTKERYADKSGWRADREFQRMWGNVADEKVQVRESPPTYEELRPDTAGELVSIDSWSVSGSVDTHPRYRDDEEMMTELDDFIDEPVAFDPISPPLRQRLRRERKMVASEVSVQRLAASGGGLITVATFGGSLFAYNGFLEELYAGELSAILSVVIAFAIGLIYAIYDVHELYHDDPCEVTPETQFDRVIVFIHRFVDRIPVISRAE